jgi:hypothetical protein
MIEQPCQTSSFVLVKLMFHGRAGTAPYRIVTLTGINIECWWLYFLSNQWLCEWTGVINFDA